jgi:hypothetical protein
MRQQISTHQSLYNLEHTTVFMTQMAMHSVVCWPNSMDEYEEFYLESEAPTMVATAPEALFASCLKRSFYDIGANRSVQNVLKETAEELTLKLKLYLSKFEAELVKQKQNFNDFYD